MSPDFTKATAFLLYPGGSIVENLLELVTKSGADRAVKRGTIIFGGASFSAPDLYLLVTHSPLQLTRRVFEED